ncbi:MAG: hypothetical protein NXI27_16895 [Alphaproteobacteria bacterium]|nr:hypothetical protein [Alphaproteobacteria bacterium]
MSEVNLSPEELSELIGLVYDSAFEPRPWQSLQDRLTTLFPGVGANVYAYDENGLLPEYTHSGGTSSIAIRHRLILWSRA